MKFLFLFTFRQLVDAWRKFANSASKVIMLRLGQPKVNKVKIFLPFQKFMKRPQTKFHADTMSHFKVIRSKKVKIYH